ncbi:MAG: MOSC domain-containing protein [Alphaproteobacteria bacterium]|nr:MAG: MOSC domain-containing protein [Alphaproteobacteria bacterium]
MTSTVAAIYRYPVKGLNAEALSRVALAPGEGLPHDRRFALAHGASRFDPTAPQWLPKTNFLCLMRDEKLAQLSITFDAESGIVTLHRAGRRVLRADVTQPLGRTLIGQFFSDFMGPAARGTVRVVESPGHMFSDTPGKVVSIIGLDSIHDLERVARQAIDPLRFRANIYIEGALPWMEFNWVGQDIAIGPVRLRVTARIERCGATNVNPKTAERDLNIPRLLQRGFGHIDMGVYAEVVAGGEIAAGDPVTPL